MTKLYHIGEVLLEDVFGKDQKLIGAPRVRALTLIRNRRPTIFRMFAINPYRSLKWDDVNWEDSGIDDWAKERST